MCIGPIQSVKILQAIETPYALTSPHYHLMPLAHESIMASKVIEAAQNSAHKAVHNTSQR